MRRTFHSGSRDALAADVLCDTHRSRRNLEEGKLFLSSSRVRFVPFVG
jgi:hypothetical protein